MTRNAEFCPEVIDLIEKGKLSAGHARTLLSLDSPSKQKEMALQIIEKGLTVRDVENLIKMMNKPKTETSKPEKTLEIKDFEDRIKKLFLTKVSIIGTESKAKIVIDYYSKDDLDRIYEILNNR